MERRIGDEIKEEALQARRELSEALRIADLGNVRVLMRRCDIDRLGVIKVPDRKIGIVGQTEPALGLRIRDEEIGEVNYWVSQAPFNKVVRAREIYIGERCKRHL